jgi:error-prone DNA polymerase
VYTELHAASAFSFLRGSSLPEDLVARAAELGYPALALVDRDGVSGAPRFYKAARAAGIRPLVGAELSLEGGGVLPLLVENRQGYQALCRLITRLKAGVPKGEGRVRLEWLGEEAGEATVDGLIALPGVETLGRPPDTDRLARLVAAFGPERIFIDVQRHRRREQEAASAFGPWPRTASVTRRPKVGRSSTPSPASARRRPWLPQAGCSPKTRNGT